MSADKKSQRIRQRPKQLEKTLFVNHKEEQGLQRRLESITTDSRVRGRLLDKERIKVRNECRFNSRLNYQNIASQLDKIPTLIQREMMKHGYTVGSVNDYLLREYRRNSRVIPGILSSVGKECNKEESRNPAKEQNTITRKPSSLSASDLTTDKRSVVLEQDLFSSPNPRKVYLTMPYDKFSNADSGETDDINPKRITSLVKDIAKIRNEMLANKKIDIMRSRISFPELIRSANVNDRGQSESDTYTDGTCVLLRRKMIKMRKQAAPDPDLEVFSLLGQTVFGENGVSGSKVLKKRHSVAVSPLQSKVPKLPPVNPKANKSASSANTIVRQHILENDERQLKRQLDEQEKQHRDMKVAIETRKYQHIQKRINDFLEKPSKRPTIPIIYETDNG